MNWVRLAGAKTSLIILCALFAHLIVPVAAQESVADFPTRPVKIVVPNPPGSGTDLLARLLADQLSKRWSKAVIVENESGVASGNVAAADVARSSPDGYTLMLCPPGPISTNGLLYKHLNYDPQKWVVISHLATVPYVLDVRKNFPATTIEQLIALARAKPNTITFASAGAGGSGTLSEDNFARMAGIKLVIVPYRGLGPAQNDLIAGQVDTMFDTLTTSLPMHRAGIVRIIGVGSEHRAQALPDVETIAEAGLPGFRSLTWFGLVAPPGTSEALADRLNKDVVAVIKSPKISDRLRTMQMEPVGSTRREAEQFFASETEYWGRIVKDANVTLE
jgi:tripartite-type tricarboxylate transporter receptor subunit TctC